MFLILANVFTPVLFYSRSYLFLPIYFIMFCPFGCIKILILILKFYSIMAPYNRKCPVLVCVMTHMPCIANVNT